jgi:ribosome recycling factor
MKIGIHERVIDQIKKQFKSNACLKDVHKQARKSLKKLEDEQA